MLESRLVQLGLRHTSFVTHTNRSVLLSMSLQGELRLHLGYAHAPDGVLRAIVRFLNPRVPRALRRLAERQFLAFPVQDYAPSKPLVPRREPARPGDLALIHRLETLHRELNARHFGGALGQIPVRLSGRMRTRLGELAVDIKTGRPIDIGLSRRHLARHPWAEVEETMLHEMVHQWQAETGLRVNHGPEFRRKAREVGVLPAAKRTLTGGRRTASTVPVTTARLGPRGQSIGLADQVNQARAVGDDPGMDRAKLRD